MNEYEKSDYWSQKAFKEGYPARSVYKLREMDEKFHLLDTKYKTQDDRKKVLDLGASPGSWSTYLLRRYSDISIVACDLKDLSRDLMDTIERDGDTGRLTFIKGDLTDKNVFDLIRSYGPYECVVCDAAPNTTGNRVIDSERSENIIEIAALYADTISEGGNFVVKYFQGGAQQKYLQELRKRFRVARAYKPTACRSRSFEVYLIGLSRITTL